MMSRILCCSLMYAFPHSRLTELPLWTRFWARSFSKHTRNTKMEDCLYSSMSSTCSGKDAEIQWWGWDTGGGRARDMEKSWEELSGLVPKVLPENAPRPFTHLWHSPHPSRPNTCNLWAQGTLQLPPQLCLLQLQTRSAKGWTVPRGALGWQSWWVFQKSAPQVRQPRTWASS